VTFFDTAQVIRLSSEEISSPASRRVAINIAMAMTAVAISIFGPLPD
jgi:hypothetical protein